MLADLTGDKTARKARNHGCCERLKLPQRPADAPQDRCVCCGFWLNCWSDFEGIPGVDQKIWLCQRCKAHGRIASNFAIGGLSYACCALAQMQVCAPLRSLRFHTAIPDRPAQADCACSRRTTIGQSLCKSVLQYHTRAMATPPSTPEQAGPRQMLQLEDYTLPRWANALSAHVRVYDMTANKYGD